MNFEVLYFVDEKDNVPVREYIKALPTPERAKVYAYLKHLSDAGYKMRRPFADYMGDKTGLYELRPGRHRVFYFFSGSQQSGSASRIFEKDGCHPDKGHRHCPASQGNLRSAFEVPQS